MTSTDLRAVTVAARATDQDVATAEEPSHIHIPRPSRLRQTALAHLEDEATVPTDLEFVLHEAA